jgi:putative membrane protein insertion efficiency factor
MYLNRIFKSLFIFPIRLYQFGISPYLKKSCRYTPSCSEYMIEAISKYGAIKGTIMGLGRLGRCNPLGGHGFDPLP